MDNASISSTSAASLTSSIFDPSASIFGSLAAAPLAGSDRPDGAADGGFYTSYWENPQADLSRLTMTMNALNEGNTECWRGDDCDLCSGVRSGLDQVSKHVAKCSDEADQRVCLTFIQSIPADLFALVSNHDRNNIGGYKSGVVYYIWTK